MVNTMPKLYGGQFGVRIPALERNLFLHQNVQRVSGDHPASYSVFSGGCSLGSGGRGIRLESHFHLVPRLRMGWIIPPVY